MLEALKFKHRIALLVALASLALVTVTGMALLLGRGGVREVSGIETRYVPLLELNRDLQSLFGRIARTLEDAASAAEEGGLREADDLRDRFLSALSVGQQAITENGTDVGALRREFEDYYRLARELSSKLISGDAEDDILVRAKAMRAAQQRFAFRLGVGTTPDRARIAAAFESARAAYSAAVLVDVAVAAVAFVLMLLVSWWIFHSAVGSLRAVSSGVERLARGDFSQEIEIAARDEFGDLAREANQTAGRLREYREQASREDWVKSGMAGLAGQVAGELSSAELGNRAVSYLARYLRAPVAVVYAADQQGRLDLLETYAHGDDPDAPKSFRLGEGIIGQAARDGEMRILADLPPDYLSVRSGLGQTTPRHLLVVPFSFEGRCMGVLEFGFLDPPSEQALELVKRTRDALGVAFRVAESRQRVQALVDEMQQQAEKLREAYQSLQGQNDALQQSEQRLQEQQEELRATNEELETQTEALAAHQRVVLKKNEELLEAQREIEQKAAELARASGYKSAFLANMSHELRTPLNSIMILAKLLAANENGTAAAKQIEFAHVIHKSGEELLALINDVLDLAKIEAGKQDLVFSSVALSDMATYVRQMFAPLAMQKKLDFEVELADDVPAEIQTDLTRLEQIVKNLLSNAIKFTERGHVRVRIFRPRPGDEGLAGSVPADSIAIEVNDTGEGIAREKQQMVFEAFSQADGSTGRKHGGTGLGLAIARQLAVRLGGDIRLESELGAGCTFILHLPAEGPRQRPSFSSAPPLYSRAPEPNPSAVVPDDRAVLTPGEACFLVIEDDATFAGLLVELIRQSGFRALAATGGREGLELARRFRPSGVVLDVKLPDVDGWTVMEQLQVDRATRDIPVHFLTGSDDAERARSMGAVGFLSKPVQPEQIRQALRTLEVSHGGPPPVLVVETDERLRDDLTGLLAGLGEARIDSAATAQEALARLCSDAFGVIVLDLALPKKEDGLAFLERLRRDPQLASIPVIVHTGVALSPGEARELTAGSDTVIILEGEHSMERVLEETRLFVHRVREELPERRRHMIEVVHGREAMLEGKRVLIVDDDMRNVYSLTNALQSKRLDIIAAADGQEALEQLEEHEDIDIVLMDIMMPRMDGHEAIRRIRGIPRLHKMPIIALTAKTMPGERQKCMDAGASDYIPKPVDIDRLLSLMRVWLSP
jgi:CheY-like chemotaxis protein/signal transduction histidine kinase